MPKQPTKNKFVWIKGESHAPFVVEIQPDPPGPPKILVGWRIEEEHQSAGGFALVPLEDLINSGPDGKGQTGRPNDMDHPQRIEAGYPDTDW